MLLLVRKAVSELPLAEPTRTHTLALTRRLLATQGLEAKVEDSPAVVAALEYLGLRVHDPEAGLETVAARHGIEAWRISRSLSGLRDECKYRAYVGEWIGMGKPLPSAPPVQERAGFAGMDAGTTASVHSGGGYIEGEDTDAEEEDAPESWCANEASVDRVILDLSAPSEASRAETPPWFAFDTPVLAIGAFQPELPRRWRAPFSLYPWQLAAAAAWEENNKRGIMQVVTGAGKTALALLLYARLLDLAEASGQEIQAVVVVPRLALVRQWRQAIGQLLNTNGLRLGEYHGGRRCHPGGQDILLITQDSGRTLLPTITLDRPVMLIADECHRLGAAGASRIFEHRYQWTLGLSATPERGGDLGFEDVLVPNLGPVIWRYGYREAVRDGIVARFALLRVRVSFSEEERTRYEEMSEKVKRLLDGIKSDYPRLRYAPPGRFWQIMGDLKRRHPHDERFDALTATAAARRMVVHLAAAKFDLTRDLARLIPAERQVLCFHERIEAADRLLGIARNHGRRTAVYHSQIPEPMRSAELQRFRSGAAEWLIACRSLDEGLDIPAVDTVLIVAGTKAPRQLIQRLGRALRRKEGNRGACVVLYEVAGADEDVLAQEGLAELRAAADEVLELDASGVAEWFRQSQNQALLSKQQLEKSPVAAGRLPEGADARHRTHPGDGGGRESSSQAASVAPEQRPGPLGRLLDAGRRFFRRSASWTGTPGNRSYYDKDSSPD